jgi:hypothetical protein
VTLKNDAQYTDLRDLLGRIDNIGELVRVDGADWNLEVGGLLDVLYHAEP